GLFLGVVLIGYLIIANLAFFGLIPKQVSYKLPMIGSYVRQIAEKEKHIEWVQKQVEDKKQMKLAGRLEIELSDEPDLEGKSEKVPFLYKLRVIRYTVKGRELAELWVDNVMALQFFIGSEQGGSPYERGKLIARKINEYINLNADFNLLLPGVSGNVPVALMGQAELFRVRSEDAIFYNTTPQALLYHWINNVRVALGATLLEGTVSLSPPERPSSETGSLPQAVPTLPIKAVAVNKVASPSAVVPTSSSTANAQLKSEQIKMDQARLRAVASVYEKMELTAVTSVFSQLTPKEAEEILISLSDKKKTQIFAALEPQTAAKYYKELIGGKLSEEPKKNFKKLMAVWEKLPSEETMRIFNDLTSEQCRSIIEGLSVKKKARLMSDMQAADSAMYLKLLRK
ncbi:MAG: hypothetical protein AABZ14_01270, partial [Candidatus Margulisiibacteriota bacterium]